MLIKKIIDNMYRKIINVLFLVFRPRNFSARSYLTLNLDLIAQLGVDKDVIHHHWLTKGIFSRHKNDIPIKKVSSRNIHEIDFAIVAIFRDMAWLLPEWISYYQEMGCAHFVLYNHMSADDYKKVLDPYIQKGVITLIDWNHEEDFLQAQITAYTHGLTQMRGRAKWVGFVDIDEFIVPSQDDETLLEILDDFKEYPGITINWMVYGSIKDWQPGKLLIEQATKRPSVEFHDQSYFIKTIVQPEYTVRMACAHRAVYFPGLVSVDTSYKPVPYSKNFRIPYDRLRINHYYFPTHKYFERYKKPFKTEEKNYEYDEYTGNPDHPVWTEIYDPIMNKYILKVKNRLEQNFISNGTNED